VNLCYKWAIYPEDERLNPKYIKKNFKSARVKVIVWTYFTSKELDLWIVCDKRAISTDEYENIIYKTLFSLINDLLELPDNSETIRITDKTTFLFM